MHQRRRLAVHTPRVLQRQRGRVSDHFCASGCGDSHCTVRGRHKHEVDNNERSMAAQGCPRDNGLCDRGPYIHNATRSAERLLPIRRRLLQDARRQLQDASVQDAGMYYECHVTGRENVVLGGAWRTLRTSAAPRRSSHAALSICAAIRLRSTMPWPKRDRTAHLGHEVSRHVRQTWLQHTLPNRCGRVLKREPKKENYA